MAVPPDGWPKVNRYPGPGSPCRCQRYFQFPYDPPMFWEYWTDPKQTHPQWTWLNDTKYLQADQAGTNVLCAYRREPDNLLPLQRFWLEFNPNPDYPSTSSEPHQMKIDLARAQLMLFSQWELKFPYGNTFLIYRDAFIFFPFTAFAAGPANTPDAVRPIGTLFFKTKQCITNWKPNGGPI